MDLFFPFVSSSVCQDISNHYKVRKKKMANELKLDENTLMFLFLSSREFICSVGRCCKGGQCGLVWIRNVEHSL